MGSTSSTNDETSNSITTEEVEVLEQPLNEDSKVLESTLTDEEKWFGRLEECLQRTDFIERLASCKRGSIPDTTYDEEDYVIVGRDDPIQGMANTIASCIVQCPEAQDLSPIELQNAVLKACRDIKKSKGRSYWGWCKAIYRSASWGYTAVQFCANPWAVLAICRAICMFPKTFFLRFFL